MDALTMQVLLAQQPRAAWQFKGSSGALFGSIWCGQYVQQALGSQATTRAVWLPVSDLCDTCGIATRA